MTEGLWTVMFQGPQGVSGGCVIFRGGTVLGGDSAYFYVGSYEEKNGTISAQVKIRGFVPGTATIFGTVGADHVLDVQGTFSGDDIVGSASVIGAADLRLSFRLIYRAGFEEKSIPAKV